jgi:adenine-specific DNA-methyltransferase
MIKYLGSKRLLLPVIVEAVQGLPGQSVLDLFSGTSRVGHALKAAGYRVVANDHNTYAATLARCYVQADDDLAEPATKLLAELNRVPGRPGWFTQTYCEDARFFQPKNGARVDAVRERIAELALPPELEAVVMVSLMEAADRVDSTTGVQMAYLKAWATRSAKDLELRLPALLPRARAGKGLATELDAEAAASAEVDIAYLDPPYNQHKYLGNYHIWESLVRWDKPDVFGVARKRVDCRDRGSAFNSRPRILEALRRTVHALQARTIVVSFNNEGYISREDMVALLSERGSVAVHEFDFRRYVGARIGIYNPSGEKVGRISHTDNKELLFVVRA